MSDNMNPSREQQRRAIRDIGYLEHPFGSIEEVDGDHFDRLKRGVPEFTDDDREVPSDKWNCPPRREATAAEIQAYWDRTGTEQLARQCHIRNRDVPPLRKAGAGETKTGNGETKTGNPERPQGAGGTRGRRSGPAPQGNQPQGSGADGLEDVFGESGESDGILPPLNLS